MAGGVAINTAPLSSGFLKGKALIFPLSLVISLFFLWGFSYGLLDVLNKHFQDVLGITKLQSTGLQVMYFGGGYFCYAPVAAEVMRRKGYKFTILMGLALYSIGAVYVHFLTYVCQRRWLTFKQRFLAYCALFLS
jgi:MFS transporter, FHS family, L-fucose permease